MYDDFHTVIHGHFKNGVLKEGYANKIVAYRCNYGMLEIRLSQKWKNNKVYKYTPVSQSMPIDSTLMDPYEKNAIYIDNSQMPNMSFSEGVFAKRFIPGIYSFVQLKKVTERFYSKIATF